MRALCWKKKFPPEGPYEGFLLKKKQFLTKKIQPSKMGDFLKEKNITRFPSKMDDF